MLTLNEISNSLQSGKAKETSALVNRAIAEHYNAETIIKQGIIPGIKAAKERYTGKETLVPEILRAERAMNWGIKQVKLAIAASGAPRKGTVVIGTVYGETEDDVKNLMAVIMECMSLRVVDLGAGVKHERFIETAVKEQARIIVCTANRIGTMEQMKNLVQAALSAGIRDQVKIMIGGRPVTDRFRHIIGADMYAPDAASGAEIAAAYCAKTAGP
jgi:methanogenic corrinoid protein MtbC1